MRVSVDEQRPIELEDSQSVILDAVSDLVKNLAKLNRVPIRVIQDGTEFFSLEEWLNQEAGLVAAKEVNIITADIKELQHATVVECANYLPGMLKGIEGICNDFQTGNESAAIEKFVDLGDGLKWVTEVIRLCEPIFEEKGISFEKESLNGFLREMIKAWENKDFVLVADLLEYEIKPILEGWYARMRDFVNDIQ